MPSQEAQETSFRIQIADHLTAEELAALMRSMEDIYNLVTVLGSRRSRDQDPVGEMFPINRRKMRRIALNIKGISPLLVPRISYSSPGFADILGVAKAVGHLKDFLIAVTDRALGTRQRRLENEARWIANEKASSDLRFMERNREPVFEHEQKVRTLEIERKQLENLQLSEQVRANTLNNVELEIGAFSKALSHMMRVKEINPEDQASVVHWVGTRVHPISQLTENGKLTGIKEITSKTD